MQHKDETVYLRQFTSIMVKISLLPFINGMHAAMLLDKA